MYRIHQFEKQEMIVVCKPEDSKAWYDKLWNFSVELFRSMDIPVRCLLYTSTPAKLFDWMREDMKLSDDYSDSAARLILGVRYELQLRKLGANNNAYVLAQNVDAVSYTHRDVYKRQGVKALAAQIQQLGKLLALLLHIVCLLYTSRCV